ncbi:Hypothetical protein PACV_377 [Pacmanvirus A23]|uniref:Hypothetical protein n=1 Tax=Pacmanvirus A23 TaxID=1932881 RepID=UPI000A091E9B|nr:Hypothetical protein B9W72_gp373 [Pacmanvirus A23]SIP86090.1 Hypothetical protein PACV_377 [Pacmanvirus A23]
MSTPKRAARPVKPKVVTSTTETAPVADTAQQLSTQQPAEVTQPAPVDATAAESVSKRQQTSKAIGVSISSARVRRWIDRLCLNSGIDTKIGALKEQLSPYKVAKDHLESGMISFSVEQEVDGKKQFVQQSRPLSDDERTAFQATVESLSAKVPELEMKIAALSRERTRFSNEAAVALSIVCDELIQQLTDHAMKRVLLAKKKIIHVSHLHEAGVEQLSLYPLFKSLPSFLATATKLQKEKTDLTYEQTMSAVLTQAEREFKKKYAVHTPKKKKTAEAVAEVVAQPEPVTPAEPAVEAEAEVEAVEDDESSESKTSFRFYVGQVCKEMIKRDPNFKSVRISTEIRAYLSDLLVEFIQRLSSLVHLTATCMKNKTVNDVAIMRTVESLLIDGHQPHEVVEFKDDLVDDPVAYKAELEKRAAEKKADREYKIDMSKVPKVPGLVAVRTITYPTSGFSALSDKVQEKLALHKALAKKSADSEESSE